MVSLTACSGGDGRTLDPPEFPPPDTTTTTLAAGSLPAPEPSPPSSAPAGTEPAPTAGLDLVASWRDGARIPARHTCDGAGAAPALTWSGVPADAVELAVVLTDTADPPAVHWMVTGIPVDATGVAEGEVPAGATLQPNAEGAAAYLAPCAADGAEREFVVTLHALGQQFEPTGDADLLGQLAALSIGSDAVTGVVRDRG